MSKEGENKEKAVLDIGSLDIYTLINFFIEILSLKAWRDMGLRVDPQTNTVKKDVERAKMAIDCISVLIDKLEPHVSTEDKNRLRSILSDLQINFVRKAEPSAQS